MFEEPRKPRCFQSDITNLPPALAPMVDEQRWVVWRWVHDPKRSKWTKVPYQSARPDVKARTNDPSTWGSHVHAAGAVAVGQADGIGFMLKDSDFAAFDIDDCRDPVSGHIESWARDLVEEADSYTEITVSGSGLRIIGMAKGIHVHRNQRFRETTSRIETYRRATRYIVVTGSTLDEREPALAPIDALIDRVVAELDTKPTSVEWRTEHGAQHRADGTSTSEDHLASLPPGLARLIRDGAPVGRRSDQFHHTVGWLKELGYDAIKIERLLAMYPNGIAHKYSGRLRLEIERCFAKTEGPRQERRTNQESGSVPPNPDAQIELHWHGEDGSPPVRNWLVQDLLPATGKGLLSGQWGTAKTFTALDLAACTMTGLPFAGRELMRRSGVLFIAAEGANEIPIRLAGLVDHKLRPDLLAAAVGGTGSIGLAALDALPFAWIEECPPLKESASLLQLTATATAAACRMKGQHDVPLGLIIIDTLAASADFADANDAAEGQRVMNRLEEISRRTGAFVLAVDHFGKVVETGTRGSSAKEAAADVVLALLAERDIAGNISNTRMAVRKIRGGSTGLETPFSLEVVRLDEDVLIGRTTCIIRWAGLRQQTATDTPQPDRWSKSLRLFQAAMQTALLDHGRDATPFGSEGPTVRAVEMEKLRAEFVASYPADGEDSKQRGNTKRKAFQRALSEALHRKLIASRELGGQDLLWFVSDKDKEDTHGDKRDTP